MNLGPNGHGVDPTDVGEELDSRPSGVSGKLGLEDVMVGQATILVQSDMDVVQHHSGIARLRSEAATSSKVMGEQMAVLHDHL